MTSYVYHFSITSPVPKLVVKTVSFHRRLCSVRDADFAVLSRARERGRPNRLWWLRRQNTSHSVFPVGGQPVNVTGRLHGAIVGPTGRSDWSVRPVG